MAASLDRRAAGMSCRASRDLAHRRRYGGASGVAGRAGLSAARPRRPAWRATERRAGFHPRIFACASRACGRREIDGLLTGLDGSFVAPGPSGAPTRGRLDVLPTGRNFYSVDTRAVPTPAAWQLGWRSADLLSSAIARTMATGRRHGALRLGHRQHAHRRRRYRPGARAHGRAPAWDKAPVASRVSRFCRSDFDRPRVDVTCRISGFFRDAFPAQIDLVDSAARAVAALDEPAELESLGGARPPRVAR